MSVLPFEHIVGQSGAIAQLQQAIGQNRVAHAYLFWGPVGVGKATGAMAMAAALLCQDPGRSAKTLPDGCGRCPPCRRLHVGSHPDLFPVGIPKDKTRILVEQIREMNRCFSLTAMEQGWKIAIIDDAAMMNESSANALLKTLEEPPPSSLLILITSRPGSLLPTIRSRCQQVRFHGLEPDALVRILAAQRPDLDLATREKAAALANESVTGALAWCDGAALALLQQWKEGLSGLTWERPARLSRLALQLADAERFPLVLPLIRTWFQEQLRANLYREVADPREMATALLEFAQWLDKVSSQARTYNVNRQLTMEGILIRLLRLQERWQLEWMDN